MAKKKAPVDINVLTPLPAGVVATLGALIEAAWPGTELGGVPAGHNRIVFQIPDQTPRLVPQAQAAAMVTPPDAEGEPDVYGLGPEGIRVATPVEVAEALLPVLQTAFEENPGAQNYLEMPIRDGESGHTYLLTFCRSAGQTPHELRAAAEEKLQTTRSEISESHMRALNRLLLMPRGESPDTYAAGVKAAMNAVRELNFGRRNVDD